MRTKLNKVSAINRRFANIYCTILKIVRKSLKSFRSFAENHRTLPEINESQKFVD